MLILIGKVGSSLHLGFQESLCSLFFEFVNIVLWQESVTFEWLGVYEGFTPLKRSAGANALILLVRTDITTNPCFKWLQVHQ